MEHLPFSDSIENMADETGIINRTAVERWGKIRGVPQEREDRLPIEEATVKWQKIYHLFGATEEQKRDDVFAAVNAYFAVNGCSPLGRYARPIKTEGGVRVNASEVVKITGRLEGDIRQFLRARLKDSYEALKFTGVLKNDEAALARAEERGIPRHLVHLLADWFKGCEWFTAEEVELYKLISPKTIDDAKERRRDVEVTKRADGPVEPVGISGPPIALKGGRPSGRSGVSY